MVSVLLIENYCLPLSSAFLKIYLCPNLCYLSYFRFIIFLVPITAIIFHFLFQNTILTFLVPFLPK